MFRQARWRSERNKIKSVFKLQFHATQVSQSYNADALVVYMVPGDVGKLTAKLDKGVVREGTCRWENPIHETVRFVRDLKSGKINEKVYHFVVSTGSSRNGLIGEVSIDLAEYAEAVKVSTVSLPLKTSKSNMVLHILIQRLQENADQREAEETENLSVRSRSRTLNSLFNSCDSDEDKSNEDAPPNTAPKLRNDHTTSIGSDITMSSSESGSELDTPRKLVLYDRADFQSSSGRIAAPHNPIARASETVYREDQQSQWKSLTDFDLGLSTDESTSGSEGVLTRESSHQSSDLEIEKLKAELVALGRQVDVSEMELQALRKQIVKESKKGQDLMKEVAVLKDERDSLRAECAKLKATRKPGSKFEHGDQQAVLEEIRQELNHGKEVNANLRLQLQKTQESNEELILAIKDLEDMLEKKNSEISDLCAKSRSHKGNALRSDTDDDEEQKALEEIVREHGDAKETYLLEKRIMDLCNEIEIYKRDKDEAEMQMEQLALDYEILKQEKDALLHKLEQSNLQEQLKLQCDNAEEVEARIQSLETQLKNQSKDCSATINELKTQIVNLEDDLELQANGFQADLEELTRAKVEQEQRAILAEEALKKTRLRNGNTAEKLQEEFKRLSAQMMSTFGANEKLALEALAEANKLCAEKSEVEAMLQNVNEELRWAKDEYEIKLQELSDQLRLKTDRIEQMLMEIDDKANQIEDQKKHKDDVCALFTQEIARLNGEIEQLTLNTVVDKQLKDEKEEPIRPVQLQVETLTAQCNQLKQMVSNGELERENLKNQIFQLKSNLKKKEDAFINIEKKLKDSNNNKRSSVPDNTKSNPRNNKPAASPQGLKEVPNLRDKIKTVEEQLKIKEAAFEASEMSFLEKERHLCNRIDELETKVQELDRQQVPRGHEVGELSNQLILLNQINQMMERELKEMQQRYSELSLRFAEVEAERQQLVMTVRNLKNGKN